MSARLAARPSSAVATRLGDGRLHLQEGPIDLIVGAFGPAIARARALAAATAAFDGVLPALARHLPALRRPPDDRWPADASPTAWRMRRAVVPFADQFVTPMAAVAGAVADTVLAAMQRVPGLTAAYVNNRGDIAVHTTPHRALTIGVVTALRSAGVSAELQVASGTGVGGVATSGWDGRSFSLGIADAVTVLAADAAAADAAASLIASSVDVDHPAICRRPATDLDPDSDLGPRLVTTAVGPLPDVAVTTALDRGATFARHLHATGQIVGALLAVQGRAITVGAPTLATTTNDSKHKGTESC